MKRIISIWSFLFFLVISFLLMMVLYTILITISFTPDPENYIDSFPLFFFINVFGLTGLIQLMISPRFCFPWWKNVNSESGKKPNEKVRFQAMILSFIACILIVAYPEGEGFINAFFRFLLGAVCAIFSLITWSLIIWTDIVFLESEKQNNKKNEKVKTTNLGSSVNNIKNQIETVYAKDKFKRDLLLNAWEDICSLQNTCDEIEFYDDVADDNLRKVLATIEDMFMVVLKEPARLNDDARRTFGISLTTIKRIAKNLLILIQMRNQEPEKCQRVQDAFVKFDRILSKQRDNLFSSELEQLGADLSMLENDISSISRGNDLNKIMNKL